MIVQIEKNVLLLSYREYRSKRDGEKELWITLFPALFPEY